MPSNDQEAFRARFFQAAAMQVGDACEETVVPVTCTNELREALNTLSQKLGLHRSVVCRVLLTDGIKGVAKAFGISLEAEADEEAPE